VTKHVPSKYETLSSSPSSARKKQTNKKNTEGKQLDRYYHSGVGIILKED
jgi:hypothetical protein